MDIEHLDDSVGEPPTEMAEHFGGQARIQSLPNPFSEGPAIFAVHFEPGGRSRPHVHPDGQVLIITSGRGMVGSRDGRREVEAGDVVVTGPGEWHWHGATPSTPVTHVTVQRPGPDSIDWDVDQRDWEEGY
ncbi:MAG TPA: cupin domain-containing protein [Acidimicrobiales bacterium]